MDDSSANLYKSTLQHRCEEKKDCLTHALLYLLKYFIACSSNKSGVMFNSTQPLHSSPFTPLTSPNPPDPPLASHPLGTSPETTDPVPISSMYLLSTSSGEIVGHQSPRLIRVANNMARGLGMVVRVWDLRVNASTSLIS